MPCPERFKKAKPLNDIELQTKDVGGIGWYKQYRDFWERVAKEAKKVKG